MLAFTMKHKTNGTNSQPIQTRNKFNSVPVYVKHTRNIWFCLISVYLVVSVCSQTFLVTHGCMHIHIKLSFSTEINVYSIPNVWCMRQRVWSRLYLA